jgi:hypothetical protein
VLDLSNNSGVTDEGVAYLSRLTSLEELNLHNTRVSSLAAARLKGLKRLQRLDLSDNLNVDEKATPYLAHLVALKELDLHHTHVKLTQGNIGWLKPLAALEYLNLAETGSDCGAVVQAVPSTCRIAGSRTSSRNLSPGYLKERELGSLRRELALQYNYKMKALSAQTDATIEVHDFIPSPEIFPPKITLERMIALTTTEGMDPKLMAARPSLQAFADKIGSQPSQADSPRDQARQLLDLARSNAALCKLYIAAIDLEFADRYDEYVEYFEILRSTAGLTDVEQREYQEASKYLRRCLYDAIQELGLPFDPSSDDHGDVIIRVWGANAR